MVNIRAVRFLDIRTDLCSGRRKQLLSQEQLKLRRLMSVKLCPVSVVNRARLELHNQGNSYVTKVTVT